MKGTVIGIDTGGTFTDGVLMNFATRDVLSSAKVLTTHHDLKEGVIGALDALNIEDVDQVKLVGISSTLATNSIAQGNNRSVGLLLIGHDRELMEDFGLDEKLGTGRIGYVAGGHNAKGVPAADLDEDAVRAWIDEIANEVDAIAVSSYFSPLNPGHERRAEEMIRARCPLPVVLGHQLSTRLDSVKRAATAALNASLVAVMHEFVHSVRHSLREHRIKAPLMIVRGDGTLMPYEEAVRKPVETVLSGPAASANGACFLTGKRDMLVLDMGSTTTDMALVVDGRVIVSNEGARVGSTQTSVESARIVTLCVGCDSRIAVDRDGAVTVGPEKIIPLALLAARQPEVARRIAALAERPTANWRPTDIEYWFLCKEPGALEMNDHEARVVEVLREGPRNLTDILDACGLYHPGHMQADALINSGIIGTSALTPSDLLHVNGTMELWDEAAARQAVQVFCHTTGKNRQEFVDGALELVVRMILEEAMIFLACQDLEENKMPHRIDGKWGRWLFEQMIEGTNPYLSVNVDSRYPLVGVGAPAKFFIHKAARTLSAPFIAPAHFAVANAVGAVSGLVMETREAIAFEREIDGTRCCIVKIGGETHRFQDWDEACDFAEKQSSREASRAALEAGAANPQVEMIQREEGGLHRFLARAMGNPRLSDDRGDVEITNEIKGDILCKS
ncbi:MAG: hydantoinase/oxoprolinase family protein [Opitutales bacterium]